MIAVTGGTGFLGRHLIARLLSEQKRVRVLARHPAEIEGAEFAACDITDRAALLEVIGDCRALIHLVGIIEESGKQTFQRVHVEGTRNVVAACQTSGVNRLLHVSALGTRPKARSRYHRSKWQAEEIVRESNLDATIVRPSAIFGRGDHFVKRLRDFVRSTPVLPVIGDGTSLIQPIWVEDVVSCLVVALRRQETIGETYELGGPEAYGFEQLLDLVAEGEGLDPPKVHLPSSLARPAASVLSRLTSRFPITPDQLTMLMEDNVCDIAEMRQTFGITPAYLRDHLSD
ncbi:MAG: complex I NDUFA9 subunit family protein [Armatimonadetes bacterium]|nr:complex I NDUFA9 subunit family protein [Armatimonadota bacterium]